MIDQRHSDIFAGVGVMGFVGIHLAQINTVVQIVGGAATALAAALSIIARFRKNKKDGV